MCSILIKNSNKVKIVVKIFHFAEGIANGMNGEWMEWRILYIVIFLFLFSLQLKIKYLTKKGVYKAYYIRFLKFLVLKSLERFWRNQLVDIFEIFLPIRWPIHAVRAFEKLKCSLKFLSILFKIFFITEEYKFKNNLITFNTYSMKMFLQTQF